MPERRWQQLSAKAAMSRAKRKVQMQRMDANDFDIPILCKWDWTDDSWSKEEAAWYLALEDDAWKEEKNLRSIGRSACYCPLCREYRRYNVETLYCTEQQYYEQRAEHWYR